MNRSSVYFIKIIFCYVKFIFLLLCKKSLQDGFIDFQILFKVSYVQT